MGELSGISEHTQEEMAGRSLAKETGFWALVDGVYGSRQDGIDMRFLRLVDKDRGSIDMRISDEQGDVLTIDLPGETPEGKGLVVQTSIVNPGKEAGTIQDLHLVFQQLASTMDRNIIHTDQPMNMVEENAFAKLGYQSVQENPDIKLPPGNSVKVLQKEYKPNSVLVLGGPNTDHLMSNLQTAVQSFVYD